jgi:glutamate dehydrogenase/leucine dehydrogenase
MFDGFTTDPDIQTNFWKQQADIFIPAAASRLIRKEEIEQLIANGLHVVACGANVPFADPDIFFGPIAQLTDKKTALIPDFVSNCGMARVFAYLMSNPERSSAEDIFRDVANTISNAMDDIMEEAVLSTGLTAVAYKKALSQLEPS